MYVLLQDKQSFPETQAGIHRWFRFVSDYLRVIFKGRKKGRGNVNKMQPCFIILRNAYVLILIKYIISRIIEVDREAEIEAKAKY